MEEFAELPLVVHSEGLWPELWQNNLPRVLKLSALRSSTLYQPGQERTAWATCSEQPLIQMQQPQC